MARECQRTRQRATAQISLVDLLMSDWGMSQQEFQGKTRPCIAFILTFGSRIGPRGWFGHFRPR